MIVAPFAVEVRQPDRIDDAVGQRIVAWRNARIGANDLERIAAQLDLSDQTVDGFYREQISIAVGSSRRMISGVCS